MITLTASFQNTQMDPQSSSRPDIIEDRAVAPLEQSPENLRGFESQLQDNIYPQLPRMQLPSGRLPLTTSEVFSQSAMRQYDSIDSSESLVLPSLQYALQRSHIFSHFIKDHRGDNVTLTWTSHPSTNNQEQRAVPPFPFQLYITTGARITKNDKNFAESFVSWLEDHGNSLQSDFTQRFEYRVDVYQKAQPNILACVEHQRREIQWRAQHGVWPALVEDWKVTGHAAYKGFIMVIEYDGWKYDGWTFVHFDPIDYNSPIEMGRKWYQGISGDFQVVEAFCASYGFLMSGESNAMGILSTYRMQAGGNSEASKLQAKNETRLNNGLVTHVTTFPVANFRLREYEDLENSLYDESGSDSEDWDTEPPNPDTEDDGWGYPYLGKTKIKDLFIPDELCETYLLPFTYKRTTCLHSSGGMVSSIWDGHLQRNRPEFSITLYCSRDLPAFDDRSLFHCLNKGLVKKEAWTLEIKRGAESMAAAFEAHRHESAIRSTVRLPRTRSTMKMILEKVAGQGLSAELLQIIEDFAVPTSPVPNYSNHLYRPFQNFFLYLDASCLEIGPSLVYSRRIAHSCVNSENQFISVMPTIEFKSPQLRVAKLRFWHRISDEIHMLRNFFHAVSNMNPPTPRIPMARLVARDMDAVGLLGYPELWIGLVVNNARPIVVQTRRLLSVSSWDSAFEVLNTNTGEVQDVFHSSPSREEDEEYVTDSWARTQDLGFNRHSQLFNGGHLQSNRAVTIYPGRRATLYQPFHGLGNLTSPLSRSGKSFQKMRSPPTEDTIYVLRVKPGISIPRWTWGTHNNILGPYSLPPIPVTTDLQPKFKICKDRRGEDCVRLLPAEEW